jgi:nucleosome binding factor SPN SPT16 subunit
MGLGLFAMVPYVIGLMFIFIIIAQANIENYRETEMTSFLLAWTIGYEFIAVFLLLLIVKSAITFQHRGN